MTTLHEVSDTPVGDMLAGVFPKIRDTFRANSVPTDPVETAFRHHFHVRGKETRARISIDAGHRLLVPPDQTIVIAACVECLHNASLVQDDLQDGAIKRRSRPSVFAQFGSNTALALTNRLLTTAFACLGDLPSHIQDACLSRLHHAVTHTTIGQSLDLSRDDSTTTEALIEIARMKSGPFFALALEIPLLAANHTEALAPAHEAACAFGLGYQIHDDLKDADADRLQPSDANIANHLVALHGAAEGTRRAKRLARDQFEKAIRLCEQLPSGSGHRLRNMAAALLHPAPTDDG